MSSLEDAERLQVSFTVSDIASVRAVLDRLRETGAIVDPRGISIVNPDGEPTVEIAIGSITAKQWEALELAYVRGYYDRPRKANLDELAHELDISTSAVSQRLHAAEARLVHAVLESLSPWLTLPESR